jgi:hypothetical protein
MSKNELNSATCQKKFYPLFSMQYKHVLDLQLMYDGMLDKMASSLVSTTLQEHLSMTFPNCWTCWWAHRVGLV